MTSATPTGVENRQVAVLLANPKFPFNVGNALRACALLGAPWLFWTGDRVPPPEEWEEGARLPREERMKCYARTQMRALGLMAWPVDYITMPYADMVPVCVEISNGGEDLRQFEHPTNALYVFGPEDGNVPKGLRTSCHRFVEIPTADGERTPFNLAAAVNIVLYDRLAKQWAAEPAYVE